MARILRVSIKGNMPSGEEWSVNPVYAIGGDFGVPVSPTQANTIAVAIAAVSVPGGLLTCMSSTTTVAGCRVEARALNGDLETQAEALKGTAQAGTGAAPHPYQTSAVLSLRTPLAGASGRGRLYWPATGLAIDTTTLRMGSSQHLALPAAAKTYLSGIQAAIDVTLDGVSLVVWSRKGTGSTQNVNSIQAGNIFDTQRRRRDQLIETYAADVYP